MVDAGFQYSEAFLQWIWENGLFDTSGLRTECGKVVQILDPGDLNATDGPDFKFAKIVIDDLVWHGDVELHLKANDWYNHNHHLDANYNNVFLHVVANGKASEVEAQNGSKPYLLNLGRYLSSNLKVFLQSFENQSELPCSGNVNFISEEVFREQLDKAHSEYLEKKADDILALYDPEMVPSKAWKKALILSVWDGLGIAHNRAAMKVTGERLLATWSGERIDLGIDMAMRETGLIESSDLIWNLKGVRPANHPKIRIKQAVQISYEILNTPFEAFLSKDGSQIDLWDKWGKRYNLERSSRMKILFGTVYLPSLYVLGMLFAHNTLKAEVRTAWKELKTPIPKSLLKKFNTLPLNEKHYSRKLGAIHQLKSYCRPRRCSECFVLKNAIQS